MEQERRERMSERFRLALALFDFAQAMYRHRLRRDHPDATDAEIDRRIASWLQKRPGAELGDCPGPARRWPPA
jgi:hypothetical protein